MTQARALYQLQLIELDILERAKRVKAIKAELADDLNLRAAKKTLAAAKAEQAENQKRMQDIERQIETVVGKREATETRLYSGSVANPTVMQDMQRELEALTRRREQLEDDLLTLMLEGDDMTEATAEKQTAVNDIGSRIATRDKTLNAEKAELTRQIDQLRGKRKSALADVPAEPLRAYNELRASKANRPVARTDRQRLHRLRHPSGQVCDWRAKPQRSVGQLRQLRAHPVA